MVDAGRQRFIARSKDLDCSIGRPQKTMQAISVVVAYDIAMNIDARHRRTRTPHIESDELSTGCSHISAPFATVDVVACNLAPGVYARCLGPPRSGRIERRDRAVGSANKAVIHAAKA